MNKTKIKGFTLVELIVVITILAILALISFISFSVYLKDTRDANRLRNMQEISKWLDLYYIAKQSYPISDNINYHWQINWTNLFSVWKITDSLINLINMNKIPKDPLNWNETFMYWVNANQDKYQIWVSMEKNVDGFLVWDSVYKAKVIWNYNWIMYFNTWWSKYLTNVPSLLLTSTWVSKNVELLNNTWVYFVVNNNLNLPYKLNDDVNIYAKPWNAINLELLSKPLSYTDVSSITLENYVSWSYTKIYQDLWTNVNDVWSYLFWNNYDKYSWDVSVINWCKWYEINSATRLWNYNWFVWWDWSLSNPYLLCNSEQLVNVKNYLWSNFKLVNSIDISNYWINGINNNWWKWWTSIWTWAWLSSFRWSFDWNNYEISGLSINTSSSYVWLFWYIEWATIKNLKVSWSIIWNWYLWLIAWNSLSWSISNVSAIWTLSWSTNVWWLIWNFSWTLLSSLYNWNIFSTWYVVWWAVWVLQSNSLLSNISVSWNIFSSYNNLWWNCNLWWVAWNNNWTLSWTNFIWNASCSSNDVWWITWINNWTVIFSYSSWAITWSWARVWWVVWWNSAWANIDKCYSVWEVTGKNMVWWVIWYNDATLAKSYSRSKILAFDKDWSWNSSAWGLVWYNNFLVSNSWSSWDVYWSWSRVWWLIWRNNTWTWTNLFSYADTIVWSWTVWALVASNAWNINNSYWDNDLSNPLVTSPWWGTSKTTSQMKNQTTFTWWDFVNIWNIDAITNNWYPFLR